MAVHILDAMVREGFEKVVAIHDRASNLRAFLGIHDTSAGPAFGGIRRFGYRDERTALGDCLRLARAMSFKCALADLPGGGGKIVVLDHPDLDRAGAYRHLGDCIDELDGRYYAGPDVGTGERELSWVAERTAQVTRPGADGPGDLGAATAAGVFAGMASALRLLDGEEDWARRTVVIQGLGRVGEVLAARLVELGTRVIASELDPERLALIQARLGLEAAEPGEVLDVPCDVFSPCAMGGILHDLTVPRVAARIVCGSANNPLAHRRHGELLHARRVLFVPDAAVSAGALIRGMEFHQGGALTPLDEIEARIGAVVDGLLEISSRDGRAPSQVARDEALRRLAERRSPSEIPPAASQPHSIPSSPVSP